MTREEKRRRFKISLQLEEMMREFKGLEAEALSPEVKYTKHYKEKLESLTIPELHHLVHYRYGADEWKRKMAFERVEEILYRCQNDAIEWFELEAVLRRKLEGRLYSDDQSGRASGTLDRIHIARLDQRMLKFIDYKPESNCP